MSVEAATSQAGKGLRLDSGPCSYSFV